MRELVERAFEVRENLRHCVAADEEKKKDDRERP